MAQSRSPTQAEVINRAGERVKREIHVSGPAQVLSYDSGKQVVTLQPLVAEAYYDANDELQIEVLPALNGVPVFFPAGGQLRITFPVQPGDQGMVVFCDRSIDGWALHGGQQQPTDARRHHLSDAWFLPGVRPQGAWQAADASVITIGDDGKAGDFVATANRVQAQLGDLASAIAGWTPVPNDGGLALRVALLALFSPTYGGTGTWPAAPASATVKVLG